TLDLGFILQGPYRTTPARDNVPHEDEFNKHLIAKSAELLIQALPVMRDIGILDLNAIATLPVAASVAESGFLRPLYDVTRAALGNEAYLPSSDGSHVSGMHAKIARGSELVNLFGVTQLTDLFGSANVRWVDAALTETSYPELHEYLVGLRAIHS